MDNINLQLEIDKLKSDIKALNDEVYRNNFSAHQDFNKSSNFSTKLKIPSYSVAPTTCEVGEIIEVSGVMKICSATNTWTTVGTQT